MANHTQNALRIQHGITCYIIKAMKILIVPSVCIPDCGSAVMIARNLTGLFHLQGFEVAICADRKSRFSDIAFYESPSPIPSRRIRSRYGTTPEEYFEDHGAFSTSYLLRDYKAITEAITDFQPDRIIEIERPAAVIAAVQTGKKLFSVVSSPAFRNREFRVSSMNGLNEFLTRSGMEQVLRFRELYHFSSCIGFGPSLCQSFPAEYPVRQIGMSCIEPLPQAGDSKLSIVISESGISSRKNRQILESAFLGAPYEIYIHARRMKQGRQGNLHFLQPSRHTSVNGSRVCIHDGSDAITQYCYACGVPQVIVHDNSWQRSWNAAGLRRTGAGLSLEESQLSMERLYETYRMVAADDSFAENAQRLKQTVHEEQDLTAILPLLGAD